MEAQMAERRKLQRKLRDAGIGHIKVISRDNVRVIVDGEPEYFHRGDEVSGHPMSGLRSFGTIVGDHRMIQAIADDVQAAFEIINK